MKNYLVVIVIAFAFGCAPGNDASGPPKENVYGTEPEVKTKPPIPTAEDMDSEIASAKSKYLLAKAAFEKGTGKKDILVDATIEYGIAVMNGPGAPRQKYPESLQLYEDALKLDPKNSEAEENKKLILDIYKSMGKTPPKSGK